MFLKDRMILDPSTINIGQGSTARDVIDVLEGAPVVEVTGSDEDDTYDECVIGSVRNIQYKEKKFYGDIWIHPDYFCVNGYSIETVEVQITPEKNKFVDFIIYVRRNSNED